MEIIKEIIKIVVPAAITGFLVHKHEIKKQKIITRSEYLKRQLNEFYAPMVGYSKKIRVMTKLQKEVENIQETFWKNNARKMDYEPFKETHYYHNEQNRNKRLPYYDKMLLIFNKKIGLANEETKKHYDKLNKYVKLFHRYYDKTIPMEVLEKMEVNDANLLRFHENLENELKKLQEELSSKK